MPRFAVLVLAAVLPLSASLAEPAELAADPDYQAGLSAMQDQLPDLAITRFEKARTALRDEPALHRLLTVKIGEASVRAARMQREPAKAFVQAETALEQLSTDDFATDEDAIFWAGQAALVLGRFGEAADFFARLAEARDPSLRNRSQLARAHLLAAMQRPAEAHQLLETLTDVDDLTMAAEARLLRASLLLAEGRLDELEALFPAGRELPTALQQHHQRYLLARLAQARGEHAKAAALFRPLAESREQPGATIQHGAVVGLAESLHANEEGDDQTDESIDLLINLIDQHPHTPLLEAALTRLLAWSQAEETLKGRVIDRLRAWANAPGPADPANPPAEGSPQPAPSPILPEADAGRAGYALYYYARHLATKNEPATNRLAAALLDDLRADYPDHPLAPASLLESARLQSAGEANEDAIATLAKLETSTASPALKAEAAKLTALLRFQESDFKAAADAFTRARELLEPGLRGIADLNAGISLLRAGDPAAVGELLGSLDSPQVRLSLQLEQALYQASRGEGDARPALDHFLRENPAHPRAPEAQLAFAAELLRLEPEQIPAQVEARARLDEVDPAFLNDRAALRHLLARLELAHLTRTTPDWKAAIAHTRRFLERRDAGTLSPAVRLKLAEAYYMNDEHVRARIEFLEVADQQKDGLLHEVALLFAARAALKLHTEKSPEEAAGLLRRVIAIEGVTANEARLLLARSLIIPDPSEALATLAPLLAEKAVPANQIQALVLAAEAHRALGDESNYREAIRIYDRVLARPDLSYALSNRFHSLKGQAYELLNETEKARESYYRVVNQENLAEGEAPGEWYWYTECGFKLVRLLEREERWESALSILRKLSESGSPRAPEAAERFNSLQLERLNWETP